VVFPSDLELELFVFTWWPVISGLDFVLGESHGTRYHCCHGLSYKDSCPLLSPNLSCWGSGFDFDRVSVHVSVESVSSSRYSPRSVGRFSYLFVHLIPHSFRAEPGVRVNHEFPLPIGFPQRWSENNPFTLPPPAFPKHFIICSSLLPPHPLCLINPPRIPLGYCQSGTTPSSRWEFPYFFS